MGSAADEVTTGIKRSMSFITEALLGKVALEKLHFVPGCIMTYHQFAVFIITLSVRLSSTRVLLLAIFAMLSSSLAEPDPTQKKGHGPMPNMHLYLTPCR